jgi:hypothetical protein
MRLPAIFKFLESADVEMRRRALKQLEHNSARKDESASAVLQQWREIGLDIEERIKPPARGKALASGR